MLSKHAILTAVAFGFAHGFKVNRDGQTHDVHSHYAAPASALSPTYAAPSEETIDLSPIIIGVLVLTGLSLLFPTYVSLATSRRRRSADSTQGKDDLPAAFVRNVSIVSAALDLDCKSLQKCSPNSPWPAF